MSATTHQVNAFWYRGGLGEREVVCLTSFVQHGYGVDLYSYDEGLSAPDGVTVRRAASVIPESEVFFYDDDWVVGKISAFSNLFRYAVLHARGGWWIDTDVICLRRLPEPEGFLAGVQEEEVVNTAVMFAPAGTALVAEAIAECRAIGKKAKWGQGGPALLSRLVKRHGLADAMLASPEFYPINWSEAVSMLLLPENAAAARRRCASSRTLHLWNEMFGRAGIPKHLFPPAGSFLAELFEEIGFGAAGRQMLEADFVRARLDEAEG